MIKYSLVFIFFLNVIHIQAQEVEQPDSTVPGTMNVKADFRIKLLTERYKEQNEGKKINGFRIQLYSGNRKGAFDLKANFIRQFNQVPCEVIYESPDFKVQVGNYRTELEAEKAMQEIWPIFKSAFIVRAKIDFPKLWVDDENEEN